MIATKRNTKHSLLPDGLIGRSDNGQPATSIRLLVDDQHRHSPLMSPSAPPSSSNGVLQPTHCGNGSSPSGQRKVTLPQHVIAASLNHPVLNALLAVEVGVVRSTGCLHERLTEEDAAIFIYCMKGRGWCEVGGGLHEIGSGDLLVIPPRAPHAYGAKDGQSWTVSWVQALGMNLGYFLSELGTTARSPVLQLGEDPRLVVLFNEALETLAGGCSMARLLCASQATAHLISVAISSRSENNRNEPDVWRKIEQSIAYMQEHFDRPLQVAKLAAMANLSPSHYTALFKRRTGCAPIDYFIRLRMQHACHLLSATSLCVKEVAAALGYDDPFYFSRVFKSVNQVAPSDYRLMRKE